MSSKQSEVTAADIELLRVCRDHLVTAAVNLQKAVKKLPNPMDFWCDVPPGATKTMDLLDLLTVSRKIADCINGVWEDAVRVTGKPSKEDKKVKKMTADEAMDWAARAGLFDSTTSSKHSVQQRHPIGYRNPFIADNPKKPEKKISRFQILTREQGENSK